MKRSASGCNKSLDRQQQTVAVKESEPIKSVDEGFADVLLPRLDDQQKAADLKELKAY